jgi:hypothetical protein
MFCYQEKFLKKAAFQQEKDFVPIRLLTEKFGRFKTLYLPLFWRGN